MDMERLTEQLLDLAREHSLTVIEETGISGPMYRLLDNRDVKQYLAVVYGYKPERLH